MIVFPRVLILTKTRITELDGSGASLGKWFVDWPKDRIAVIHSGGAKHVASVINAKEYKVTGRERRFGKLFDRLKTSSLGIATVVSGNSKVEFKRRDFGLRFIKYGLGKIVLETGLWELVFDTFLSSYLSFWIEEFQPEVLFAQPTDLGFMKLCWDISKKYNIPICIEIGDDYPETLYANSLFSMFLRTLVKRRFERIVHTAKTRIGISNIMCEEYGRRYGVNFDVLYYGDSQRRFDYAQPKISEGGQNSINLVYCGSLYLRRWQSIVDIASAAARIEQKKRPVIIHVYTSRVEPCAIAAFQKLANILVHDMPADVDVPSILKGADILLLPESFEPTVAQHIRFSLASKTPLYMMSQRPILVYGPSDAGTIRYAKEWKIALVVEKEGDIECLVVSINRLLRETSLVKMLNERAKECVFRNHELQCVHNKLFYIMDKCINNKSK